MHPNAILLNRLYTSLDQHDHQSMAACYHQDADFSDIAFDLHGRTKIHAMWHMICEGDIRATFQVLEADGQSGRANLVDDYTFSSTGRKVRNEIESQFRFRDGLIVEHRDFCDPRKWASMALGGAGGVLAGSFRLLRSRKADKKLSDFIKRHPEYARGTAGQAGA